MIYPILILTPVLIQLKSENDRLLTKRQEKSLPVLQITSSEVVAKHSLRNIISFLPLFDQICMNTMAL